MASDVRKTQTKDERALLKASKEKDVERLTSLLQKGVCPNVYDVKVCRHEKKKMIESEEERKRESLAHFLSSSLILTFFSGLGKFLPPVFGCGDDA